MLLYLLACTSTEAPLPEATVDDPRAYVRDAWTSDERTWLSSPWMSARSPAVLDPILDDFVRRERFDTLPSDRKALDRFVRKTSNRVTNRVLDSDAGRAEMLANIRQRFEQPEVTLQDGIATADLGFVPGDIVPALRAGHQIEPDPALLDGHEPARPAILRGFRAAHAKHPDAKGWVVTVQWFDSSQRRRARYGYTAGRDRLFVTVDSSHFVGFDDVGGIDQLIAGSVPTHSSKQDSLQAEWQLLPQR